MNKIYRDAGMDFRRLIHRAGWTQAQIAEHLGISQASLSGWAARGIPASRVLEVARLLDANVEDVEQCVYTPKASTPRGRSPYTLRAMEDAEDVRAHLIETLQNSRISKGDLDILLAMTLRLADK